MPISKLPTREPHQKKIARKGHKSLRGQAEYYEEIKERTTISITPTAKLGLNKLSKLQSLSVSELIERIGREIIKLSETEARGDLESQFSGSD